MSAVLQHPLRRHFPAIAGGLFLLLGLIVMIWLIRGYMANSGPPPKPKPIQITLVTPPPPPEKPPEPEKQEVPKDEVKIDTPPPPDQPVNEAPPPGEQLGVDSDATGAGDGFGLAARKGGQDITTLGSGSRNAWYARAISRQIEDELKRIKALQGKDYQLAVQLWFDVSGAVTRVRIERGSGDGGLDEILTREMRRVALREALPDDLPQPVRLKVVSR